jgi:hypothetical protein
MSRSLKLSPSTEAKQDSLLAATGVITTWGVSKRVTLLTVNSADYSWDLGAAYKHIRIWSDPGSSTYRLNFGAAAADTQAKRDDGMVAEYHFATAVQTVRVFGDGTVGSLNVEAWN